MPSPQKVTAPNEDSKGAGHHYTVNELLSFKQSDGDWIVENLIRRGDQVLLAGPPKSGKSLVAAQLAILVAAGGAVGKTNKIAGGAAHYLFANHDPKQFMERFKGMEKSFVRVTAKKKVLYVSLEMKTGGVGKRVRCQLEAMGFIKKAATEADAMENLRYLFDLPAVPNATSGGDRRRSVDLVLPGAKSGVTIGPNAADVVALRSAIFQQSKDGEKEFIPDLVVLDTLIQVHSVNENANPEMRAVMQAIKAACTPEKSDRNPNPQPVAHVVLHHARKERFKNTKAGAQGMRGAGAIHSEADVAVILNPFPGDIACIEVSARDVGVDEIWVEKIEGQAYVWTNKRPKRKSEDAGQSGAKPQKPDKNAEAIFNFLEKLKKKTKEDPIKFGREKFLLALRTREFSEDAINLRLKKLEQAGILDANRSSSKGGAGASRRSTS